MWQQLKLNDDGSVRSQHQPSTTNNNSKRDFIFQWPWLRVHIFCVTHRASEKNTRRNKIEEYIASKPGTKCSNFNFVSLVSSEVKETKTEMRTVETSTIEHTRKIESNKHVASLTAL